jgi:hypothetical protein
MRAHQKLAEVWGSRAGVRTRWTVRHRRERIGSRYVGAGEVDAKRYNGLMRATTERRKKRGMCFAHARSHSHWGHLLLRNGPRGVLNPQSPLGWYLERGTGAAQLGTVQKVLETQELPQRACAGSNAICRRRGVDERT